jgi:peroxiredoxin
MITPVIALLLLGQQNSPVGKTAPEFIGKEWINSEKPLTMANRKGKVTLVYFWTFACYNCQNNMPAVKRIAAAFKQEGVETISIHTPEIAEEKVVANVKKAIEKRSIKYPVLIDGEYANWKAWGTGMWPTVFVIDKQNKIRGGWEGELNYNGQNGEAKISQLVRQLLKEK